MFQAYIFFLEHARELHIISLIEEEKYKSIVHTQTKVYMITYRKEKQPLPKGDSSSSPPSLRIMAKALALAIFQATSCSPAKARAIASQGAAPLKTQSLLCLHNVQASRMMRELRPFYWGC
jgi:hypothetical protein